MPAHLQCFLSPLRGWHYSTSAMKSLYKEWAGCLKAPVMPNKCHSVWESMRCGEEECTIEPRAHHFYHMPQLSPQKGAAGGLVSSVVKHTPLWQGNPSSAPSLKPSGSELLATALLGNPASGPHRYHMHQVMPRCT